MKSGETSKLLDFAFASPTNSEIVAGLRVESKGAAMLELPPQRFLPLADTILTGCRIVADGDARIASQQSIAAASAPEPLPGLDIPVVKLTYRCDEGWKFFRVVPADGDSRQITGEPRGLGLWIYGDGRNTIPRLRIVDATGQTLQPSGDTIDWTSWRYVEFDFNAPAGHWGGANDGVLHFPLRWDTLILLDNVSRLKTEGTLYLASPTLIY